MDDPTTSSPSLEALGSSSDPKSKDCSNEGLGSKRQEELKRKALGTSSNSDECEHVLMLIQDENSRATSQANAKRASKEVFLDETVGKEEQVRKKRRINIKPQTVYSRIEKKIKAVSQKKYQSHYGSKGHAGDVFEMLINLIDQFCIENNKIQTDPILAFNIAKAGFTAVFDHWPTFERPGYASWQCKQAFSKFGVVLNAALGQKVLSSEDLESTVELLEDINACMNGYGINESYEINEKGHYDYGKKYNIIERIILILLPDYDRESRTYTPNRKLLNSDRCLGVLTCSHL